MVGGPATYRMVRGEALYRTVQSGEGGIRTPETLSGLTVFKTAGFNHSPTPPFPILAYSASYGSICVRHAFQGTCLLNTVLAVLRILRTCNTAVTRDSPSVHTNGPRLR